MSDGAGCVVLAKRSYAQRKGLPIMGRFVSFAAVGVDPKVMGIGPAVAIPAAIEKAGLRSVADVDLFELNEAFASQASCSSADGYMKSLHEWASAALEDGSLREEFDRVDDDGSGQLEYPEFRALLWTEE